MASLRLMMTHSPFHTCLCRCGHVYCWSCILRYLSLSERTWRKCPICFERYGVPCVTETDCSVAKARQLLRGHVPYRPYPSIPTPGWSSIHDFSTRNSTCTPPHASVYADALRSARVIARSEPQVGRSLSMKLMQRAKGSTAVMSHARWVPCSIPYYTNDDAASFCTLLLISPEDAVADVVDTDRAALVAQLR